jgi:hypothetical protein
MYSLTVAQIDYSVAKEAMQWHYSNSYPSGVSARYGVWEDNGFIGAILFGSGSNQKMGMPFGLRFNEIRELQRVALKEHHAPVSQIVSGAIKLLKTDSPVHLRMLLSYADPAHNHHGGIYQASNWIYLGPNTGSADAIEIRGQNFHKRTIGKKYGTTRMSVVRQYEPSARWVHVPRKHVYVLPLDHQMAKKLRPLGLPYPKRDGWELAA